MTIEPACGACRGTIPYVARQVALVIERGNPVNRALFSIALISRCRARMDATRRIKSDPSRRPGASFHRLYGSRTAIKPACCRAWEDADVSELLSNRCWRRLASEVCATSP
jgi:hypothetical protein